MFGLGGLGLKIAIVTIIIAVISAAVGGFFLYQRSIVSGLEDQIAEKQKIINTQKEQIAGLIIDTEKLKTSNSSLESEIKRKSDETKDVFAEIQRLRKKDIESAGRLRQIEGRLRNSNRLKRVDALRTSRRASLLLRLQNNNIRCYAENFNKVKGRCIRGKWVDDGTRLVPARPAATKEPAK